MASGYFNNAVSSIFLKSKNLLMKPFPYCGNGTQEMPSRLAYHKINHKMLFGKSFRYCICHCSTLVRSLSCLLCHQEMVAITTTISQLLIMPPRNGCYNNNCMHSKLFFFFATLALPSLPCVTCLSSRRL